MFQVVIYFLTPLLPINIFGFFSAQVHSNFHMLLIAENEGGMFLLLLNAS
jgi:hypothetical protein